MVTVQALTDGIIAFVEAYGYLALFVFIVLETAWIIHFAPSEVVIPFAAAYLVSTPTEFALFVVVGTVGAVIGSLLAYYLFGVNGDRILQRYGHVLRVPESEVERSKAWFRRWGEGLMFWGRVVPVLRTPISVPAGFARMDLQRFTVYSFGGWAIYNAALVWLVYSGSGERAPIDYVLGPLSRTVESNPAVVAALAVVASAGAVAWWLRRERAV
ncbi:DedA family protein [Salinigranum marinum]|uniref:DedA family protein n=1 Tax=Salinigranum marinum TaxID=1515595 RepID=UPI002989F36A|nr:DedA family protein [Salinigranum marinum]